MAAFRRERSVVTVISPQHSCVQVVCVAWITAAALLPHSVRNLTRREMERVGGKSGLHLRRGVEPNPHKAKGGTMADMSTDTPEFGYWPKRKSGVVERRRRPATGTWTEIDRTRRGSTASAASTEAGRGRTSSPPSGRRCRWRRIRAPRMISAPRPPSSWPRPRARSRRPSRRRPRPSRRRRRSRRPSPSVGVAGRPTVRDQRRPEATGQESDGRGDQDRA